MSVFDTFCVLSLYAEWLSFGCPGFLQTSGRRVPVPHERTRNAVLAQLAASEPSVFDGLSRELELITLEQGAVLGPARKHTEWTYFVETGIVALVASTGKGNSVEV